MKVKVFIQRLRETRILDLEENGKIEDLLKTLRISVSEVIPVKNGVIVTEKEPLGEGDEIKLLSVVSGG
ncbi:MAG: MoaD/ThiS family protein [Candidatus Brockarchaeota archaeon]|nr:MoaD/ThiS family protein [Candidatus Brockarchaeota archaeon]